jgi:hypothetical protein
VYKIGKNRTDNDGTRYERVGQNTKEDYWTGQDRRGRERTGKDKTGNKTRKDRKGQDRTGQDTTG